MNSHRRPVKRWPHMGLQLTASQIAHDHGLALQTVQRRLQAGLRDGAVVLPARSYAPGSLPAPVASRPMTEGEARAHLRRAMRTQETRYARWANAIKAHDNTHILAGLKLLLDKSQASVSYWRERVRMAAGANEPRPVGPKHSKGWVAPENRVRPANPANNEEV